MRHTAHTVRAARLAAGHRVSLHSWFGPLGRISRFWHRLVGVRWQRLQCARAARRYQRLAGYRLWVACGRPAEFAPQPSRFERFCEWVHVTFFESQREVAAREWRAVRQQARATRHLWPARYR